MEISLRFVGPVNVMDYVDHLLDSQDAWLAALKCITHIPMHFIFPAKEAWGYARYDMCIKINLHRPARFVIKIV